MPQPRSSQISLSDTPYYHCFSRCVRRAFLCGTDSYSGQSYEHRRGWVEQRLLFLSSVFAIDICSYAVMSNHVHMVLHVDVKQVMGWTDKDIVRRWHLLHKGTFLTQMFAKGEGLSKGQKLTLDDTIAEYRRRLHDISWLMRNLNEYIAREAKLQSAGRNQTNQDIAASIIGHIRRAALGEALIPFEQRVTQAMQRIYGQHNWLPAQRKWLERLAKQLTHEVIIDRDFVNQRFAEHGGAKQLDRVLVNQLDVVLDELSEAM